MWTLLRKEISGFFSTLTGYLVITVFLVLNSLFIWIIPGDFNVIESGYATLDPLFAIAPWVFLFLVPAITMRMFSEEKRTGTLELLSTRPVTRLQVILSKFLAAWALVLLSLLPTLVYFWSVSRIGSPPGNIDAGGTWGSYIGLLFLGGIYASIGIFTSSLTSNQVVAFILALVISFLLYLGFDFLASLAGTGQLQFMITRLGIENHYGSVSRGVLDSRDILYFLLVMALFLAATRSILRTGSLLQLGAVIAAVVLISLISGRRFFRIDLTGENRYTLAPASRELMRELDERVYVRVYLAGDLPAEFVHFQKSIRELLNDFRAYAGDRLQYEFINLYDEPDETVRNRIIGELYDKGLRVTNIQMRDREGGVSGKIIFPGAVVSSGGYEMPVNLLKNNPAISHEQNLNNSIETMEYEFIRAISSLTAEGIPRIAFIEGHGELDSVLTHSLMDELKNFFQVDRGHINGNVEVLTGYEALIVARPVMGFSEADRFAIDQYIMQGGKVLFFLDPVDPFADSLTGGTTVALARPVGLEELLFRYGVRVNYNLVADLQCNMVPVNTAPAGEPARFTMVPWVYHPLLAGPADHPVTRGLNYVRSTFASSMDTLEGSGGDLRKTVLLATSGASRAREVPVYISMEEVTLQPDPELYNRSGLPVAVLMEGTFTSFYRNYPVPPGVTPAGWQVIGRSQPTSVFVASDGDLPANEVQFEGGAFRARPLGYDRYTRQTFGNREFIMNVISYMTDRTGIMELRSREFKLRLLNREVTGDRGRVMQWRLFNTLFPVALVVVAGLLFQVFRRRRYTG